MLLGMKFEHIQKFNIFMKFKNWKLNIIKDITFDFLKYIFQINLIFTSTLDVIISHYVMLWLGWLWHSCMAEKVED
jgi:hypothetical protein